MAPHLFPPILRRRRKSTAAANAILSPTFPKKNDSHCSPTTLGESSLGSEWQWSPKNYDDDSSIPLHFPFKQDDNSTVVSSIQFGESVTSPEQQHLILGVERSNCARELDAAMLFRPPTSIERLIAASKRQLFINASNEERRLLENNRNIKAVINDNGNAFNSNATKSSPISVDFFTEHSDDNSDVDDSDSEDALNGGEQDKDVAGEYGQSFDSESLSRLNQKTALSPRRAASFGQDDDDSDGCNHGGSGKNSKLGLLSQRVSSQDVQIPPLSGSNSTRNLLNSNANDRSGHSNIQQMSASASQKSLARPKAVATELSLSRTPDTSQKTLPKKSSYLVTAPTTSLSPTKRISSVTSDDNIRFSSTRSLDSKRSAVTTATEQQSTPNTETSMSTTSQYSVPSAVQGSSTATSKAGNRCRSPDSNMDDARTTTTDAAVDGDAMRSGYEGKLKDWSTSGSNKRSTSRKKQNNVTMHSGNIFNSRTVFTANDATPQGDSDEQQFCSSFELPMSVTYLSLVLPTSSVSDLESLHQSSTSIETRKNSCGVSDTTSTEGSVEAEEDETVISNVNDARPRTLSSTRVHETVLCNLSFTLLHPPLTFFHNYRPPVPNATTKNLNEAIRNESPLNETASKVQDYLSTQNYASATEIYRTILAKYSDKYGPLHPLVISVLHSLTVTCIWNGNYKEASRYCREGLRARKKLLGPNHLDVANSLSELGVIHYSREEFNKALEAWREALQITCKHLGYNHCRVGRILNNIGCAHYETGKLIAALATFEESLDIQRSIMGKHTSPNDSDCTTKHGDDKGSALVANEMLLNIATAICNIGMMNIKRRQMEDAASLLEEGLMVQESVLGDNDRRLIGTRHLLESLLDHQDAAFWQKYTKNRARDEGFATKSKIGRRLYITQLLSCSNGGRNRTVAEVNQVDSDLRLFDKNSVITKKAENTKDENEEREKKLTPDKMFVFGEGDVLVSKRGDKKSAANAVVQSHDADFLNLGSLRNEISIHQRVVNTVVASFTGNSSMFGYEESRNDYGNPPKRSSLQVNVDDECILDPELHLAQIYDQAVAHIVHHEFKDALELLQSVLNSHKVKYGRIHHLVGSAWHSIGIVHLHAGNYREALASFKEAIDVRTAVLGSDHSDVSASLLKFSIVLLALEDFDNAHITLCQILRVQRKLLGYSHPQIAKILNNIGVCHYEFGGLLAALKAFEEVREIQREAEKKDTESALSLAVALNNVGFVHVKRKEYAEAIVALEEALQIQRKVWGNSEKDVNVTLENLAYAMAAVNCNDNETLMQEMTEMYFDMLRS